MADDDAISDSDSSSGSDLHSLVYGERTATGARGRSILRQRYEAEQAKRRGEWDRALRELFTGPPKAVDEKEATLRGIVERDQWFVPVRADGAFETIVALDREYGLAFEGGPNRREKGRQPTRGKGGRLLPIFDEDPGRLLAATDRARSLERLMLAVELHKLLPPDADRIPRSAIRTVTGATVLREHPHARSRAWIEATIRQVARYTKTWVWFG